MHKMPVFLAVTLALLSVAVVSQDKFEQLKERRRKTPLLQFENDDFERYITRGPRNYWMAVELTALSQGSCQPCKALHPEVEKVSEILNQDADSELFIAHVDFVANRNVFQKLGLATAPMLVLVPPTKSKKQISLKSFLKSLGPKYQYSMASGRTSKSIVEWLQKTSKLDISQGPSMELPDLKVVLLAVVSTVVMLYLLRRVLDRLRKQMGLYILACMAAYSFCIGGGMFNFIRHTPWIGKVDGKPEYVSRQSRWQYTSEGYMVSAVNLLAGVCAFLYINSQSSRVDSNVVYRYLAYIPSILTLAATVVGCYTLLFIYTLKNRGYDMGNVGMFG